MAPRRGNRLIGKGLSLVILAAILAFPLVAAGPLVVLVGPPGSGRTTQAEFLKKELGLTSIAADDLIARNQAKFQKYKVPELKGVEPRLDPALNGLVEEALTAADVSKGVVLDGYPASKIQGDFLSGLREKLHLAHSVVIHLSVPDDVVRRRLKSQNRPDLEQELKDYHREFDFMRDYFPAADIRTVDGTKDRGAVAKEIRKIVESLHD